MTTDVRMTSTTLADGRELIYFDDSEPYVSGGATRTLTDARPLPDRFAPVLDADGVPQPVTGPELRRDPLTGEWIPMAAHRMNRTFLPPADANPLAPAKPGAVYQDGEIPAEDYDVVVFENRFPSLLAIPGIPDAPVQRDGEPIPLPYISGWHQAPTREGRDVSRLHLQLFSVLRAPGKLKYLAGVESGMGAWISDTTPERIATRLQELA